MSESSSKSPNQIRNGLLGAALVGSMAAGLAIGYAVADDMGRDVRAKNLADVRLAELNTELAANQKTIIIPGGVLRGTVHVDIESVGTEHPGGYENPIILSLHDPSAKQDAQGKFLDGGYIAVPGSDATGRPHFSMYQVETGEKDSTTVSIQLTDAADPVLDTAIIYTTNVTNAPQAVFAADTTGNVPGMQVSSFGMK